MVHSPNNLMEACQAVDKKRNFRRHRESTHYAGEVLAKMRKTELLENSLSVGSKNRLRQYKANLAISRGTDHPYFDKHVANMLRSYILPGYDYDHILSYLDSIEDSDGYKFSRNLKIYSTTEEAMEKFSQQDYTSFRWNENYRSSLEEMIREFSKLRLKPVVFNNDDDIKDALPKLDTHSGYYWIQTGNKYKGENLEGLFNVFASEMEQAYETGSLNKPILIGFRTQASGEFNDDGSETGTCKHKTRVVSMIDIVQIVAELSFSKPIQKYLAMRDYYAGGKEPEAISAIINNWKSRYSRFMSIDYSSFDQTISSWLIEDAFRIIRSAFVMNELQQKQFDIIVHDFIHKDFILSQGILHSDKGVPSGSMFTQIIDSIVNVLVVKTYFKSIGAKAEMIVMGDDNAIFTNAGVSISDLASYVNKNFGLIVKVDDKSAEGLTRRDDVKFLSRFWKIGGQWRHPNSLVSRMLYPERYRDYDGQIGPEHVIFAFILTYKLGMQQFMNIERFMSDYPISKGFIMNSVDSRYLPGALAFIREYT